jgi:hypothetical protein
MDIFQKLSEAMSEKEYIRLLDKMVSSRNKDLRDIGKRKLRETRFLTRLMNDDDWTVRHFLARFEFTAPYMLAALAHDKNLAVVLAVALNMRTPEYALKQLESHESMAVKYALILNKKSAFDGVMIEDKNLELLAWLMEYMNTFNEINEMAEALNDGSIDADDEEARSYGATMFFAHIRAIEHLERSSDMDIRYWATANKKIVLEGYDGLSQAAESEYGELDADDFLDKLYLADTRAEYNAVLETMKAHKNQEIRELYRTKRAEVSFLGRLANSKDWQMRFFIANFEPAPAYLLGELSHDTQLEVLLSVAANSATPKEGFEQLAKRKDLGISYTLMLNEIVPESICIERATNTSLPALLADFLFEFTRFNDFFPSSFSVSVSYDDSFTKRMLDRAYTALKKNLKRLENYGDPDVKEWAKYNLLMITESMDKLRANSGYEV